VDVDCGCVPIELPTRELIVGLIRLLELTAGCLVVVDGRVITRLVEFVGCRETVKFERDEFPVSILTEAGFRVIVLVLFCVGLIRLVVILVEVLPGIVILDRGTLIVLGLIFRFILLDLFVLARDCFGCELEAVLLLFPPAFEGRLALDAGAGCDACCFADDELLDFLLLLDFCAKTGSVSKIKAASTIKANVSFCWYFGLNMI
jgi:hypothetical protein